MTAKRVFRSEHGALFWECRPGLFTHSAWYRTACNRSEHALQGALTNLTHVELAQGRTLTDVTAEHPEVNEKAGA
jgi:hypothetical protein